MKSRKFSVSLLRLFTAYLICIVVYGCAFSPNRANHGFGFNTFDRLPEIIVLEYRYGERGRRSNPESMGAKRGGAIGDMEIAEFIYVRWRRLDTNETFTHTVNLKGLLPSDMDNKYILLEFRGPNLGVFLEDRSKVRPPDAPIIGPFKHQTYVTTQIFYTN
jgi:hypothetical protein